MLQPGTDPGFQTSEAGDKPKKKLKKIQIHIHIVLRNFQTKTNSQKSLFFNILRCNHLPTKTKDTKYYYFLIHITLFLNFFFFLKINMDWVDDS